MTDSNTKIVIMGMENAGKTTLVKYITQEFESNQSKPPEMSPTRGIERSQHSLFGNPPILIWDFGGQEIYRNEYLSKPNLYFNEIAIFFYVVDVQDNVKFFSSRMYFMAVLQLIRKHSPDANIVFLFHKSDPEFTGENKIKERFLDYFKPVMQKNKRAFQVYDTTIYDIHSILKAFKNEIKRINLE